MNKPVYLGQAILDLSKTLMYEFYYDYLKPMYKDNVKLCYMDTDSFILHIQTEDFYKDIANDANRWFDTSGYKEDNRPLTAGINKRVIGKFKDELNGDIMNKFCAPKANTYAFTIDDSNKEIKKAKGTKKCVIKNELTFKNDEESVLGNKTILKSQLRFRSDHHSLYTDEVNKIAISPNDDKRIQTFGVTTYSYDTNAFKVFESEMLAKIKDKPIAMYY